jgi:hypothetical protein
LGVEGPYPKSCRTEEDITEITKTRIRMSAASGESVTTHAIPAVFPKSLSGISRIVGVISHLIMAFDPALVFHKGELDGNGELTQMCAS